MANGSENTRDVDALESRDRKSMENRNAPATVTTTKRLLEIQESNPADSAEPPSLKRFASGLIYSIADFDYPEIINDDDGAENRWRIVDSNINIQLQDADFVCLLPTRIEALPEEPPCSFIHEPDFPELEQSADRCLPLISIQDCASVAANSYFVDAPVPVQGFEEPSAVSLVPDNVAVSARVQTKSLRDSVDDPDVSAWLRVNFQEDPRSLLSRELVFGMYRKFAADSNKALMNPACLGKAMRKVFTVTNTRRLGKRGDSKYHYSGIDVITKARNVPDGAISTQLKRDTDSQSEIGIDYLNCRSITGEQIKVRRKTRRSNTETSLDHDIVTWLQKNFQPNGNSVIPRDFVFKKYRLLCAAMEKPVMNPACFGKTLRGVFAKMETRRLGCRGNSKYHYAGIEINPTGEYAGQSFSRVARRKKRSANNLSARKNGEKETVSFPNQAEFETMKTLKAMMDIPDDKLTSSLMPPYLMNKSSWSAIAISFRPSSPISAVDVDDFFCHFRIHIGMMSHAFISGAFLALPEIFENFWVTRTKSLQVPGGYTRNKLDRLTAFPPVQEAVQSCYLSAYDLLIQRLIPTISTVIPVQFSYVLTDFLHKFPFWIRMATADMRNLDMRAVICHAAGAFAVQLEKLTKLSLLEEKIFLADPTHGALFETHCFRHVSHTLSELPQRAEFSTVFPDSSRRALAVAHCMLEQPRDLARFECVIRKSISGEFQRLSEQFCGVRLLREKEEVLTALHSCWNDTLGSCIGEDEFARLIVTSWQLSLSLLIDRESAAVRKNLPMEAVFKAIAGQLGNDIPELPPGTPDMTLQFFMDNNIQKLECINSSSLNFFHQSVDLKHCLDGAGIVVPLDFRDTYSSDVTDDLA